MKTMNCKQLGGACDKEFSAETFEEIAQLSKQHGTEMYEKGDVEHLKAMQKMKEFMNDPEAMKKWIEAAQTKFNELPHDKYPYLK